MTKEELFDLKLLKKNFEENEAKIFPSNFDEIKDFQNKYDVEIPEDLRKYYLEVNGSGNETLNNLYKFHTIHHTKRIFEELIDWIGSPDYSKLKFDGMENVFVFAEYHFNLYAFGIELYQNIASENRIFILCGEDFRIIANSFTEFIDLYLNKPEEIYI